MNASDVFVIGGGIVGLSIAWRATTRGLTVTLADPDPGSQATRASAGMLAPVSEVTYTEEPLLRLGLASLERWPAFAGELEAAGGIPVDLRGDGTVEVAYDADDLAQLDELAVFEEKLGLRVERLTGRQCRQAEPMLSPNVRGGLLARDDLWVNPRRVAQALQQAFQNAGGRLVRERVTTLEGLPADHVVVAAGAWSPSLLPGLPIRPVKGQILRLRGPRGLLGTCVRGTVRGSEVYLVPRDDGEIVVGATMEELGFDTRVTAGGVYELLRDAREIVPGITELELAETFAGLRPGTPDNLPYVGRHGDVWVAAGHHRAGVLLAPLTADAVVAGLFGEADLMPECTPARI
ncbi:glycine oxidase ThiO [Herbidospora sp. NEAU-GS84]|uniref:glycine oxidase n=1 Tax=Herbidospora solisilvae TaxID=2696284 RepID=A0A7C9N161_9ACTN|nr:glycine oxidase ThiO [Herbidospora solisilvae]NAS22749.1 glycine oxidase ThiO [Herbidospora solisilvae]